MINRISFDNFRGIKHLEIPDVSQITLLTGRNNAGKSSILEGIFLFMDHTAVDSFGKINGFRGLQYTPNPTSLWEPAFFGLDTNHPLRIEVDVDGKKSSLCYERDDSYIPADKQGAAQNAYSQFTASTRTTYTLKFLYQQDSYKENGSFSINETGFFRNFATNLKNNQIRFLPGARFISSGIHDDATVFNWIGKMELQGKKQQVIDVLRNIEPEITDIITISNQGQTQVYAKVMNRLLPVKLAGDGLNRLLYIVLAILEEPNSILLIDEIDTGFHYSMLKTLWKVVAAAAKESNCQVIATTHSYECIDQAVGGIDEAGMLEEFCLYRITHSGEKNTAVRYSGDLVKEAVASFMEVR